jgi:hypothetical protein
MVPSVSKDRNTSKNPGIIYVTTKNIWIINESLKAFVFIELNNSF